MVELFANSGYPNQMPHSAASDMGLQCLPVTHLGVSQIQWVKCLGGESNPSLCHAHKFII